MRTIVVVALVLSPFMLMCRRERGREVVAAGATAQARPDCDLFSNGSQVSDGPVRAAVRDGLSRFMVKATPPGIGAHTFEKRDAIARQIHGVPAIQDVPNGLDGADVHVAVVDVGAVWPDHEQFQRDGHSRVIRETAGAADMHSTHVAGTIASAGFKSNPSVDPRIPPAYGSITAGEASKGIAPGAILHTYSAADCSYDTAVAGTDVSNFSIVRAAGWERRGREERLTWMGPPKALQDPHFGRYDESPRFIDEHVFTNPVHLVVAAAGNDQDPNASPTLGTTHWDTDGILYPDQTHPRHNHERDTRNNGLKSVHSWCVAKNVLCVGSINDRSPDGPIIGSPFSNLGPTDDGRVKPDLVANGATIMSLAVGPNPPFYSLENGTSSAAPTVSGIAALVLQALRRKHVESSAALLKAILIHTAEDGGAPGPDPKLGWGMARADLAVAAISQAAVLRRIRIAPATPVEMCFSGAESARPRVTAAWTDPPGLLNDAEGDDPTPALLNDIDLDLVSPNGGEPFQPWVLQGSTAHPGPNHVDNVEMITVHTPHIPAGRWRLRITPYHLLAGSPAQEVALVVSGLTGSGGC
jgi:hypothetical protein